MKQTFPDYFQKKSPITIDSKQGQLIKSFESFLKTFSLISWAIFLFDWNNKFKDLSCKYE